MNYSKLEQMFKNIIFRSYSKNSAKNFEYNRKNWLKISSISEEFS